MTTINLNDEIWTGIDVQRKNNRGKVVSREFQRIAITTDMNDFLKIAQYILDGCPDVSRFVIIHKPSDMVISFSGLVNTIGMKSKRYNVGPAT